VNQNTSFLRKWITQFNCEATDTTINFYVYSMESLKEDLRDIDELNIAQFYQECLSKKEFDEKYLCSSLVVPSAEARVIQMDDEECELLLHGPTVLLLHPNHRHKQGKVSQVEIHVKIPLDKKLVKNFCNYDLRVNIHDGAINLNKKFLKSLIRFFVYLDTLNTVIKAFKRVVMKQYF